MYKRMNGLIKNGNTIIRYIHGIAFEATSKEIERDELYKNNNYLLSLPLNNANRFLMNDNIERIKKLNEEIDNELKLFKMLNGLVEKDD